MNSWNIFHIAKRFINTVTNASRTIFDGSGKPLLIEITSSAEQKLKEVLSPNKKYLRVLVESGGCHGFQYKLSLDNALNSDDIVFERNDARVVIDELSLPLITGSKVDYQTALIGSTFVIVDNPAAGSACGCGTSFNLQSQNTNPNKFS